MAEQFDPYYKWLGIPADEQPPHFYRLLGLRASEDDPDVISNAADQRMAHLRSFQSGKRAELSQRLLNEVATAQACLLNAKEKAAYDDDLKARLNSQDNEEKVVTAIPLPPAPKAAVVPAQTTRLSPQPVEPAASAGFPMSTRPASSPRSYSRRMRKRQSPLPFVVAGGVVLVLIVGLAIVLGSRSIDGPPLNGADPRDNPAVSHLDDDRPFAGPARPDPPFTIHEKSPPDDEPVSEVPTPDTPPDAPPDAPPDTRPNVESIWIEGENPTVNEIVPLRTWYDVVHKNKLSGGDWAGHFTEKKPGFLAYEFQASNHGDYHFWVRANPVYCKLFWRLNDGDWQLTSFSGERLREKENIAGDNKLDIRFIAWVKMPDVRLERGMNRIEFRMETVGKIPKHQGAIDCFCFTSDDWEPSGLNKPPRRN